MNYNHIKPGTLEIYCGPMKSGKTREILHKIDKIKYLENCNFLFMKPKVDTRNSFIKSRFSELKEQCITIDETNPKEILSHIKIDLDLLIIDEVQFFSQNIVQVVEEILKKGKWHQIRYKMSLQDTRSRLLKTSYTAFWLNADTV